METWIITKIVNHYLTADQQTLIVLAMASIIILDRILERLKVIKPNKTEELIIGFVVGGLKALKGADYEQQIERTADGLVPGAEGSESASKLDTGKTGVDVTGRATGIAPGGQGYPTGAADGAPGAGLDPTGVPKGISP